MTALLLAVTAMIAYFFGQLPGAVIISRYLFRSDCRRRGGRCNPGYGEFQSRYGVRGVAVLMAFDAAKGLLACLIGGALLSTQDLAAIGRIFGAFCCILGHNYPVLQRFMGGKGTFLAGIMAFAVDWRVALCCWGAWVIIMVFTRYLSLACCAAAVLGAIFMWIFQYSGLEGAVALICALAIVLRWHKNLRAMLTGTEPRLNLTRGA